MAIRDKRIVGGNGINYTKECDSSSDYAVMPNSTYFRDVSDGLIYYKDSGGTVIGIFGSLSGRFGIANSFGVYIYYPTLTLAIAAAVSGQTIDVFADVVETGNVEVVLKDGVVINGNGHTYTLNNSGIYNCLLINATGNYNLKNYNIVRSGSIVTTTYQNLCIYISSPTVDMDFNSCKFTGSHSVLQNTFGLPPKSIRLNGGEYYSSDYVAIISRGMYINSIYIESTASNSSFPELASCLYAAPNGSGYPSVVTNIVARQKVNGIAVYLYTSSMYSSSCFSSAQSALVHGDGGCYSENCIGQSDGLYGIYGSGFFKNCSGSSSASLGFYANVGRAVNCNGYSLGATAFFATNFSTADNCHGYSTGGVGFTITSNVIANNCSGHSTVSFGGYNYNATMNNCVLVADAAIVTSALEATILSIYNKCTFHCRWANAAGHCVSITTNLEEYINCTFIASHASANALNAAAAKTIKYSHSDFRGMTTPVHANVTQGITNIQDLQGNLLN